MVLFILYDSILSRILEATATFDEYEQSGTTFILIFFVSESDVIRL